MGSMPAGIAVAILFVIAVVLLRKPLLAWRDQREADRGRRDFRRQRELLEAKFFDLAAVSGKPRGLRWVDCDWLETVTFARDRQTGLLTAFVAVNISFEAIEGGDMEDVAAVGNIREAAAVFHYQKGHWGTGGRALFNMNPDDALDRLQGQFKPLHVGTKGTV
ncbi:MAG TPA: hypothetical protein VGH74_04955 [Planctomycetaceae bacterium]